jgi:hypothetical protein
MTTTLDQAVILIKAGNIEEARPLLIEYLKQNPGDENAWLWMSRCVTEAEQKRYCFEKVLKINPQNPHAIKGLERLNNPAPSTAPPKPVQQPVSQAKPKKNNSLVFILVGISLLGLCLIFVCGIALLFFPNQIKLSNLSQPTNSPPTQKARTDYVSLLLANGFRYTTDDGDGNPIYVSSCGLLVTVKPGYTGFVSQYNPENDNCAAKDMGRIISIMYPSEVFNFVFTNMSSLKRYDEMITGTAVGYKISVALTEYGKTYAVIISDPQ